jgi:hypothetical protein
MPPSSWQRINGRNTEIWGIGTGALRKPTGVRGTEQRILAL